MKSAPVILRSPSSADAYDVLLDWTNRQKAAGRTDGVILGELKAAGIEDDSAKAYVTVGRASSAAAEVTQSPQPVQGTPRPWVRQISVTLGTILMVLGIAVIAANLPDALRYIFQEY